MSEKRDHQESTVSAIALQPLLFVLSKRGIDSTTLLGSVQIAPESVAAPNARIPLDQYRAIWHQAVGMSGDPALGVHVGLKSEPSAFGPVGYVLLNARDCRTAFQLWNQFSRLILDAPLFELTRQGDIASISVARTTNASPDSIRPMTEFVVFSLLRVAVFLTNINPSDESELIGLEFRHARPADEVVATYTEAAHTTNIRFSAGANRILFNAGCLDRPVAYADPAMLQLMIQRSDQIMQAMAVEGDIVARARAAIRRRLAGQTPTLAVIARDCNMSPSTLQRRLKASGARFQQLLDQVRLDFAKAYLNEPNPSLEELSFLLGYSDSTAFHHAFRRWTGMSSIEYRMQSHRLQ